MHVIYLAAPLFSNAERNWNKKLRDFIFERSKYDIFLPQESCSGIDDPQQIYAICKEGIETSQVMVAVLDGSDCGTAWEVGYAKGLGKPVIGIRTDFRKCEVHHVNIVLHYSVDRLVQDFSGSDEKIFREVLEGIRELLLNPSAAD
jgi:nucleoside 2-deoxyribosyltransferase